MKRKKRGETGLPAICRIVLINICGIVILFLLMLISALFADRLRFIILRKELLSKLFLAVSSCISGMLSSVGATEKRFPHALAGEVLLFIVVSLFGIVFSFPGGVISYLFDISIVLIGAFAGTFFRIKRRKKRRVKRNYRE